VGGPGTGPDALRAMMHAMELQPGEARFEARGANAIAAFGEIDVATAPELRSALNTMIDGGASAVEVDMAGVTFIDSSGLGALIAALKRARQRDSDITISNLAGATRRVFEITGLVDVFKIDG
jgi:anti-sigma B factor antagonist